MKVTYRGCEIECYRDETIEGDDVLSYSIVDKNDGYEVCSGITWYYEYTEAEYIESFLKEEVDNYIKHPEEYRDDLEDNEETYVLTPKGIAIDSLLKCGLISDWDDPRAEGFWMLFEHCMRKSGYIVEEEDDN